MTNHTGESNMKLFAVYLGGRALKCNTELHDVVFVVGETIEDTYDQLMDKWFGTPEGLHLDSWMEIHAVDGHSISLQREKTESAKRLYFVNLGAYIPGQFTEAHANTFIVAENERDVKTRAKAELLRGLQTVHTDDLFDIDDCLEISDINGYHVMLTASGEKQEFEPVNGYHIVPKPIVRQYMERNAGDVRFAFPSAVG